MDLVDYSEDVFEDIVSSYNAFATKLDVKDVTFIPISALEGDNVVNRSQNMPWYNGSTLMYHLEHVHISSDFNHTMHVSGAVGNRPHKKDFQDYRGYAGRIDGGVFQPGDAVKILPSGFASTIKSIELNGTAFQEAYAPMSVTMTLEDDIDVVVVI